MAIASALLVACATPRPPALPTSSVSCPTPGLPAYAHNDYENEPPLVNAVALGYRGVEADVFLVNGVLRVGHDAGEAARGGALEALYLKPLSGMAARCPERAAQPFLLFLEVKESSRAAYDSTLALLARYEPLVTTDANRRAPVSVVMVGWHPMGDEPAVVVPQVMRQRRIRTPGDTLAERDDRVRLVSLDYGKTIGRRWSTPRRRRAWMSALYAVGRNKGGRLLRVHNVPVDARVYQELLDAGVDLIGTKELEATQLILTGDSAGGGPPRASRCRACLAPRHR